MRALLAIVVLAVIFALVGWITVDTDANRPSATIETEKIQEDLGNLGDAAKQAGSELEQAADNVTNGE